MRDRILAAAEKRVRAVGFADTSFRDIATDVGVKSASIHYHFPTKADLGVALVAAYTERFAETLASIDPSDLATAFDIYAALYDKALVLDEAICLCAIMGAEAIGLPRDINEKTAAFFRINIEWLSGLLAAHEQERPATLAQLVVTSLEGAMIVSSASHDRSILASVTGEVRRLVLGSVSTQR
jgi:TetR/AcrR family transcriptional regulator, transcriptional repressor for nem operon